MHFKVGDYVIGRDGTSTQVLAISDVKPDKVYKVTLLDGSEIECTGDHLWTVKATYERTFTTNEIRRRLERGDRISIPKLDKPVEYAKQTESLPIHPYLMGIWLGEGCRSTAGYAGFASDGEVIPYVQEVLPKGLKLVNYKSKDDSWKSWAWHIQPEVRLGPNPVRDALVDLNLIETYSRERFVPEQYKYASVEDRTALLQGLLDGEGTCMKSGHIKMDSTSKQLIDDTIELIQSLGGIAQYNGPRRAKSGSLFWTITFTAPEGLQPFRLARKQERVRTSIKRYRGIKSVELVGEKQVKCIKVAAPDHLYVTDSFTLTENTLTRKTTAMDIAMDMILEIDRDAILATDGSIEGLFQSLSTRPGRPSIFLRDEFSGLLEQMTKKDYYAGMAETLTKLYDGKYQKRVLRREIIEVRDPVLIIFAGGIKTRILELLRYEHVASGFVPRFLFVAAESDITKLRPLGPPTERSLGVRDELLGRFRALYDQYNRSQEIRTDGKVVHSQVRFDASLTEDAWLRYNKLEADLVAQGLETDLKDLMTPTFDRMAKSGLKMATLLAAARIESGNVVVEESDIVRAFYYIEQWGVHTIELIANMGKSANERQLERVYQSILRKPGISRSVLMQNHHLSARDASLIFDTLEQRGVIKEDRRGRGKFYTAVDIRIKL